MNAIRALVIISAMAIIAALFAPLAANATGNKPHPEKPQPQQPPAPVVVPASAGSTSNANSNASAGASALGYGAGYVWNGIEFGNIGSPESGNTYVFPGPALAAPLPANLCPDNHSLAWSIGWNFFSYSRSDVGSSMECIEKLLPVIAPKPVVMRLADEPQECLYPPAKQPAQKKPRKAAPVDACEKAKKRISLT